MGRSVRAILVVFSVCVAAYGQEAEPRARIQFQGETVGSIEYLALSPRAESRLGVDLTAALPELGRALDLAVGDDDLVPDRDLLTRGIDVYWKAGTTRIRGASDSELRLTTRFELRTIGITDVRDADWTLRLVPDGLRSVRAVATVTGVEGWPGAVARFFDLRPAVRMNIPLLSSCEDCMCLQDRLNVTGSEPRFSLEDGVARLHVTYEVDSDITAGLACLF